MQTTQVEISSGDELSEAFLMDELHPQTHAYRPKFIKPPPPSGRRRSKSPNNRPIIAPSNGDVPSNGDAPGPANGDAPSNDVTVTVTDNSGEPEPLEQ